MKKAECPECDAEIEVEDNVKLSDKVDCDECGAELEVECLNPLEFELSEDDDEDEDD